RFSRDWSSDVCSSDLTAVGAGPRDLHSRTRPAPLDFAVQPAPARKLARALTRPSPARPKLTSASVAPAACNSSNQRSSSAWETRSEERRVGEQGTSDA